MPVSREQPQSPDYERSPSPQHDEHDARPGPSKKARLTASDLQKRNLEKLLANPEKEVRLPTAAPEKTMRAPRDMMKNVSGSSSGAGSGEFHVYKQSRRREYERIKIMEDKAKALEEQDAFMARQAERDAASDAKTAKNRAKRQKRKLAQRSGGKGDEKAPVAGAAAGNGVTGPAAEGKSKLAGGGASIAFKRPGDDSDGETEPGLPALAQVDAAQSIPLVTAEVQISIVDED